MVTVAGAPVPTLSQTGALPAGVSFNAATGVLSGTPVAGTGGIYPLTFTAQNGAGADAIQNFTLTVNQPPAITSNKHTTFRVGLAGTFTVTATGFPVPVISGTGTLASGVTFDPVTHVISGTPAPGTGGLHHITLTAQNDVTVSASQVFTLFVNEAAAITSANSTIFSVGTPGSFTVTATGFPAPILSEIGALPTGLAFDPVTGVLSGTPAAGTGGSHIITFKAHNGVVADALQSFTLTVGVSPVITSADTATFGIGALGSFTVTASGSPAPTISIAGTLPAGVTFDPATATLSGTPPLGSVGNYPLTFTAHNGAGSDGVQNFTLAVVDGSIAPSINSANSVSFLLGAAGSFTVTATGSPTPTLSVTGTLPAGVAFDPVSGVLSGTPAAGTLGTYPITFTAANSAGSVAQDFTLIVNALPAITMQPVSQTITAGQTATFTVAATGSTPLAFQWQRNDVNISGANSSTYTTPATTGGEPSAAPSAIRRR
jgi:hypothetical protein